MYMGFSTKIHHLILILQKTLFISYINQVSEYRLLGASCLEKYLAEQYL